MTNEDRFRQAVINTLAKRAANRCSNPGCGAITSGPTDDPNGSVNVGEAAHIYGANPGSSRYEPTMTTTSRSDISNAIWLCKICHKLVDDDELRYPAGLLFEWQREHERKIAEEVGKAAASIRRRYESRHLEEFGRLSYLAERLLIEKGAFWEYKLTAEMLRFEMAPVVQRWSALKRKLYTKPYLHIERTQFIDWIQMRGAELNAMCASLSALINEEFARGWGAPGTPGNEHEIVATCRLLTEVCRSALEWEERVRFIYVSEQLERVVCHYVGLAGSFIDESTKIQEFINEVVSSSPSSGHYQLNLKLDLPDGWANTVHAAMTTARQEGELP